MCNISSPIRMHLIVTQMNCFFLRRYRFNRIYEESKDQKTTKIEILIIDCTSEKTCITNIFQDVSLQAVV
jgi:hypothetical protein